MQRSPFSRNAIGTIFKQTFLHLLMLFMCCNAYASERPIIVIILVDDMGYSDPDCFNSESRIPTPNIDSIARDGMCFTDAHEPQANRALTLRVFFHRVEGETAVLIDQTKQPDGSQGIFKSVGIWF